MASVDTTDYYQKTNHSTVFKQNLIDAAVMSRIVGARVSRGNFHLEEDRFKGLASGITWRRRRFRFRLRDEPEELQRVGLCINEITIDSHASGEFYPALAADYPALLDFGEIENAYWQASWAAGAERGEQGTKQTRLFLNEAPLLYGNHGEKQARLEKLQALQALGRYDEQAAENAHDFEPVLFQADDGEFGIVRYLPAFPPSRLVQSSERIVAGTNAGYFLNFMEEYDDGISALHQPVSGLMSEGRLLAPPWIERPGILGFREGGTHSELFGPEDLRLCGAEGDELALHRPGKGDGWQGTVLRHFDPLPERLPEGAVQLHFCGPILVRIVDDPVPAAPPLGGAAVVLEGEWAEAARGPGAAEQFCVNLRPFEEGQPWWIVCAGPFLVRDSEALNEAELLKPENAGEFRPDGPAPTRFPYDSDDTKAPRTAIGWMPSGGMKLVVVDGRRSREHSLGAGLHGMAELMQAVGCAEAVNLDGGGSSVLAIEGAENSDMLQEHLAHGVVNIPSDDGGRERVVPVVLTVRAVDGAL